MEIILVPPQTISFKSVAINSRRYGDPGYHQFTSNDAALRLGLTNADSTNEYRHNFVLKLENCLLRNTGCKQARLEKGINRQLHIRLTHKKECEWTGLVVSRVNDGADDGASFFRRLLDIFGDGKITFRIHIEISVNSDKYNVMAAGNQIPKVEHRALRQFTIKTAVGCKVVWGFELEFSMEREFNAKMLASRNMNFTGLISAFISFSDDALELIHLNNVEDPLSICRKMMAETSGSDVILIPDNGAEVRCHKAFLSAHSPVFKAMFESGMKEGNRSVVEIPDMSEPAIRAMLAYLYCWEIKEILKSSSIAMELLMAADKYSIPRLEKSVVEVLLTKKKDWFEVGVAVQLLQFARNKASDLWTDQHFKMIEDKCVEILKSKSAKGLTDCPEFQQLFEEPGAGMEFCCFLLHRK